METFVRLPAVAGRFYPKDASALRKEVEGYLLADGPQVSALGCVVPHAGYIYSGHVAGALFSQIRVPQSCVILCPNHTGLGEPLAIMSMGSWETPLGQVEIDSALAEKLKKKFRLLEEDLEAHRAEHAIEVQLPFLQVLRPKVAMVPITIGTRDPMVLEGLGIAIAQTVAEQTQPVLILASSDMNHYESDVITRQKDLKAIERILDLDADGLYQVVMQEEISMCGFGPTVAMLTATKLLGAKSVELAKYATSGDISGDRRMVVGYAGIAVT